MRDSGLWHPRLAHLVVALGHGDLLVVADPGLPVPAGVETIDLVWSRGEPGFVPVLRAIVDELVVEHATVAEELADEKLLRDIEDQLGTTPCDRVPHEQLKAVVGGARAVVRTGEDTPYANVVLRAGVPF
jgi:D-ribose pyranase